MKGYEQFDAADEEDARDEIIKLARGRGLKAALTAAICVAEDEDAPAQARATAATTLFRLAGMYDRPPEELSVKPLEEQSPEELQATIAALGRREADLRRKVEASGSDPFG